MKRETWLTPNLIFQVYSHGFHWSTRKKPTHWTGSAFRSAHFRYIHSKSAIIHVICGWILKFGVNHVFAPGAKMYCLFFKKVLTSLGKCTDLFGKKYWQVFKDVLSGLEKSPYLARRLSISAMLRIGQVVFSIPRPGRHRSPTTLET